METDKKNQPDHLDVDKEEEMDEDKSECEGDNEDEGEGQAQAVEDIEEVSFLYKFHNYCLCCL